jgi:hypothetical protein
MKLRNGKLIIPQTPETRFKSKTIQKVAKLIRCILDDPEDPPVVAYYLSQLCTILLGNWDAYLKIRRFPFLRQMIVRIINLFQHNPFFEHFQERFESVLLYYGPQNIPQNIPQKRNQEVTPSLYCAERRPSRFFSTLFITLLLLTLIGQAGYSYHLVTQQKKTVGFSINDPV